MSVDEMLTRLSSHELTEWIAFSQIEPIGDARDDFHFAVLDALIANANRDTAKKPDPFSPQDFLVDFWQKSEQNLELSQQNNKLIAEMMVAAGIGVIGQE